MKTNLDIQVSQNRNFTVAELKGGLDGSTIQILDETLNELIEKSDRPILCCFQDITYLNSSGIGLFINLSDLHEQKFGKHLSLSHVSKRIIAAFQMVGLLNIFQIYNTIDPDLGDDNREDTGSSLDISSLKSLQKAGGAPSTDSTDSGSSASGTKRPSKLKPLKLTSLKKEIADARGTDAGKTIAPPTQKIDLAPREVVQEKVNFGKAKPAKLSSLKDQIAAARKQEEAKNKAQEAAAPPVAPKPVPSAQDIPEPELPKFAQDLQEAPSAPQQKAPAAKPVATQKAAPAKPLQKAPAVQKAPAAKPAAATSTPSKARPAQMKSPVAKSPMRPAVASKKAPIQQPVASKRAARPKQKVAPNIPAKRVAPNIQAKKPASKGLWASISGMFGKKK